MPSDPVRIDPIGPAGPIPTLVFAPDDLPDAAPIVLLGHGAHLSKDDEIMQMLARALAAVPAAVAIIDCPDHGERRDMSMPEAEWMKHVVRVMADADRHAQLTAEWTAVIAAARNAVPAATGPVLYAGFSMGAVFGLSIVGDLPEVKAALFVVGGYIGDDRAVGPAVNALIEKGVAKLGDREVLMCNMTQDDAFPIARAIEVLEAIPGPKRMGVWVGGHQDIPPEAMSMALRFFRRAVR